MFDSLRGNGRPVWPALLVPLVLLGGCSSLRDVLDPDNVEYRNARRGPGLDVPPDLVAPRADSRYTLPGGDDAQSLSDFNRQREDAAQQAGSAPAAVQQVLPERAEARIHRDGISRWIAVKASPEKVWPILQDFWAVQGFNLEVAQPRLGLMETDWAERFQRVETDGVRGILSRKTGAVYATGDRDKFRTRLERADDGGTEIYLTYYGREEQLRGSHKDQSIWVPHDDNRTELEVEYLRRMLARLDSAFSHGELGAAAAGAGTAAAGGGASDATPTADSQSPAAEKKTLARIVSRDGQPAVLQIDEDFERSWRAVGVVLDRLDFNIEDRDRSQGVYSIVYVDPQRRDQNQGTWSRLFSGERKDLSGQHYQLRIKAEGGQSTVSVLLANGNVPASEEDHRVAEEIIRILNENLR